MKIVYLAGAIGQGSFEEMSGWRLDITEKLDHYGISTLDPMRGMEGYFDFLEDSSRSYVLVPKFYVARGLYDIRLADFVMVGATKGTDTKRPSFGTLAEIGYAVGKDKPVIALESVQYVKDSPMISQLVTAFVRDLDDAVHCICDF